MSKPILTEKDFASLDYDGLSIINLPNGKNLLILMFKNGNTASKFNDILHDYPFNLEIFVDDDTKEFIIEFVFLDYEFICSIRTGKSEKSYPPMIKLKNQEIDFITTGIWTSKSGPKWTFTRSNNFKRLQEFNIGKSLQNALSANFYTATHQEIPTITLTFKDSEHIILTEANLAYDKLLEIQESRPYLEIKHNSNRTIDFRIWDILFDLEILIKGLNYSVKELENFIKNTDTNESFLFALTLLSTNSQRGPLISTNAEKKFVTIFGYKYTGDRDIK